MSNRIFVARRALARFLAIAKTDGAEAALRQAARKVETKLRLIARAHRLVPWGNGRCAYHRPGPAVEAYSAWRMLNRDNSRRRLRLDEALGQLSSSPLFSVIVPVYNPPIDALRAAISSVVGQIYPSWELIVVDDASTRPEVGLELEAWRSRDPRIRTFCRPANGNISAATNQAAGEARGEFLVLLDHDDVLDPHALAHAALYLGQNPRADILYTDDDKIGPGGEHHAPQFKPGWSSELLLSFCYTAHMTVVRTELYRALGGMRVGFEGSQDHDFWLRASERARQVGHIPQVAYHWRVVPGSTASSGSAKPRSFEAGRRAVEEAFLRRGVACRVEQPAWALAAGCALFQPRMPDDGPSVAIVISSADARSLRRLLLSLEKTTYRNYRVYVQGPGGSRIGVDSSHDGRADARRGIPLYLETLGHDAGPAERMNASAARVSGELLLFLDGSAEIVSPGWLSQLVGWARLPGVGAVGGRLLRADGTIEHAGYVLGLEDGLAGNAFAGHPKWANSPLNLARVTRNCTAVSADCLLTNRSLFLRMGGFDAGRFPRGLHDVDYGVRLSARGYRCVLSAEPEIIVHQNSRSEAPTDPREAARFRELYAGVLDPFHNPHLGLEDGSHQLRPTVVPCHASSRPIRVLAASHNLNWEGAPLIQLELLDRLKAGGAIEPTVLSPAEGPLRASYGDAAVPVEVETRLAEALGSEARYERLIGELASRVAADGFELIHANTLGAFWAIDVARAAGIPSVWSVHESEPWEHYFDHLPAGIAARALDLLAFPYRVVFASRGSARLWTPLESRGNFTRIPTPLDRPRFRSRLGPMDRAAARTSMGLSEDQVCILLLGTVCERKGQRDLVSAFALLPDDVADRAVCLIVGARDSLAYTHELRRLAQALPPGRRERVRIVDETGDTGPFWQAADVFCCTSRIESYPRVILEAMASGLPIITTPVFGIVEQVRHGVNALTYSPGDIATFSRHLARLVQDDRLRRSFAEHSAWVLRSLPTRGEMIEGYRQTFLAAAESSVPGGGISASLAEPRASTGASGRTWHMDTPHPRVPGHPTSSLRTEASNEELEAGLG